MSGPFRPLSPRPLKVWGPGVLAPSAPSVIPAWPRITSHYSSSFLPFIWLLPGTAQTQLSDWEHVDATLIYRTQQHLVCLLHRNCCIFPNFICMHLLKYNHYRHIQYLRTCIRKNNRQSIKKRIMTFVSRESKLRVINYELCKTNLKLWDIDLEFRHFFNVQSCNSGWFFLRMLIFHLHVFSATE